MRLLDCRTIPTCYGHGMTHTPHTPSHSDDGRGDRLMGWIFLSVIGGGTVATLGYIAVQWSALVLSALGDALTL